VTADGGPEPIDSPGDSGMAVTRSPNSTDWLHGSRRRARRSRVTGANATEKTSARLCRTYTISGSLTGAGGFPVFLGYGDPTGAATRLRLTADAVPGSLSLLPVLATGSKRSPQGKNGLPVTPPSQARSLSTALTAKAKLQHGCADLTTDLRLNLRGAGRSGAYGDKRLEPADRYG